MTAPTSAPVSPMPRAVLWLDRASIFALLATAFFIASVPARHPELFHALADGAHLRINNLSPVWLFDGLMASALRGLGWNGPVAVKAGALALFAFLSVATLIRRGVSRRIAGYLGIPLCLVLAPFTAVEPLLLTFLLCALTVTLVPRWPWLGVALALLWANLADAAVLAPCLGACLVLDLPPEQRRRRWLVVVALAGASFVSPEPLRALRLAGLTDHPWPIVFRPEGLAAWSTPLRADFWQPTVGYEAFKVAVVASVVLPLLLLLRFRPATPPGALIFWAASVGLTAAHWKHGPILTLACLHLCASILLRRPVAQRELRSTKWSFVAGSLTLLWALILPTVAWIGWLQPTPYTTRAWYLEPEPSLRELAQTFDAQHPTYFPLSTAAGDHLRWLSTANIAYTSRSPRAVLDEAETVVKAFSDPEGVWNEDARAVLRRTQTTHVVLFHTDKARFARTLARVLASPQEFPPLGWRGRAVVVGWRDPRSATPNQYPALADLTPATTAPDEAPARLQPMRLWPDLFWQPPVPRSADRDEAAVALMFFEQQRLQRVTQNPVAFEAHQLAGLVGAAQTPSLIPLRMEMVMARYYADPATGRPASPGGMLGLMYYGPYQQMQQDGSVALLMRGIRAARQALHTNPRDAAAFHALGECYLRLHHFTIDRVWGQALPPLGRVRLAQIAYACRQALVLDPNLAAAHETLVKVYLEQRYFDAALHHLREFARLTKSAGPSVKELDEQIERLSKQVQKSTDALGNLAGARPYDRALAAFQAGLPQRALDALLASDIAAFGKDGLQLELNLLIGLGRADDAAEWLTPDLEDMLGVVAYYNLRWQALATVGHYKQAGAALDTLTDVVAPPAVPPVAAIGRLAAMMFADASLPQTNYVTAAVRESNRLVWRSQAIDYAVILSRQADLYTQRAWLYYEQGNLARASEYAALAESTAGTQIYAGRPIAVELQKLAHR